MLAAANVSAGALALHAQHAVDILPAPVRAGLVGAAQVLLSLCAVVFIVPLKGLYMHGPTLHGYGFWGGAEPADICAQLTGMSATVWLAGPMQALQCEALLDRKFTSFAWSVFAVAYLWSLYSVVAQLWHRYMVVRPMAADLRYALGIDDSRTWRRSPPRGSSPNTRNVRRHLVWRTPTPPKLR